MLILGLIVGSKFKRIFFKALIHIIWLAGHNVYGGNCLHQN